jgi:hypothetical protein
MKITGDLKCPGIIHAKGILFLVLGLAASVLHLLQMPTLRTALLLGTAVWAFCRFYDYLFYVLERYLGREEPFAGIFDALRFLIGGAKRKGRTDGK